MIYKTSTKYGGRSVDTERIISMFRSRSQVFVAASDKEAKANLMEFLESEGFACDTSIDARDEILERRLPLNINLHDRTFSTMGNVTCAAAAASCKLIISEAEFYMLYSIFVKK